LNRRKPEGLDLNGAHQLLVCDDDDDDEDDDDDDDDYDDDDGNDDDSTLGANTNAKRKAAKDVS
jgi:hypothetical protein